jgi:hypothetical protein
MYRRQRTPVVPITLFIAILCRAATMSICHICARTYGRRPTCHHHPQEARPSSRAPRHATASVVDAYSSLAPVPCFSPSLLSQRQHTQKKHRILSSIGRLEQEARRGRRFSSAVFRGRGSAGRPSRDSLFASAVRRVIMVEAQLSVDVHADVS